MPWEDRHQDRDFVRWIYRTRPHSRILEVAGGRDAKVDELASRNAIHICLDVIPTITRGPLFVQADVLTLPFPDETFDGVLALALLEHVAEPWTAIQEFARVLKHEGRLLWHAAFRQPYHPDPSDYYRYTAQGARYLTERAGLTVVTIHPMVGWGSNDIQDPSYFSVEAVKD